MNTDRENWIEDHPEEYERLERERYLEKHYPKAAKQFEEAVEEHEWGCEHDPYYRYCCGGGSVPWPCCRYCTKWDDKEWKCEKTGEEKESDELCDDYEWNDEWEED